MLVFFVHWGLPKTVASPSKKPGKQPGAKDFGRTQKFAVTGERVLRAAVCTACGDVLPGDAPAQAYTAWDEIDIEVSPEGGLRLNCTRHTLLDVTGGYCGHVTRSEPWRAGADALWDKVGLSEWRLIGPNLAAVIAMLALSMRLSCARCCAMRWAMTLPGCSWRTVTASTAHG
jgi:transposase